MADGQLTGTKRKRVRGVKCERAVRHPRSRWRSAANPAIEQNVLSDKSNPASPSVETTNGRSAQRKTGKAGCAHLPGAIDVDRRIAEQGKGLGRDLNRIERRTGEHKARPGLQDARIGKLQTDAPAVQVDRLASEDRAGIEIGRTGGIQDKG